MFDVAHSGRDSGGGRSVMLGRGCRDERRVVLMARDGWGGLRRTIVLVAVSAVCTACGGRGWWRRGGIGARGGGNLRAEWEGADVYGSARDDRWGAARAAYRRHAGAGRRRRHLRLHLRQGRCGPHLRAAGCRTPSSMAALATTVFSCVMAAALHMAALATTASFSWGFTGRQLHLARGATTSS